MRHRIVLLGILSVLLVGCVDPAAPGTPPLSAGPAFVAGDGARAVLLPWATGPASATFRGANVTLDAGTFHATDGASYFYASAVPPVTTPEEAQRCLAKGGAPEGDVVVFHPGESSCVYGRFPGVACFFTGHCRRLRGEEPRFDAPPAHPLDPDDEPTVAGVVAFADFSGGWNASRGAAAVERLGYGVVRADHAGLQAEPGNGSSLEVEVAMDGAWRLAVFYDAENGSAQQARRRHAPHFEDALARLEAEAGWRHVGDVGWRAVRR